MNQLMPRAGASAPASRSLKSWSRRLLPLALLPAAALLATAQAAVLVQAGNPADNAPAQRLIEADDGSLRAATATDAADADAGTPPAAPTALSVKVSQSVATLNWSAVDGATSYNLYESVSPGGEPSTPILSNISGTSATVGGIQSSHSYYFTVAAVNAAGVSGFSPEASVTPVHGGGAFGPLLLAPLFSLALLRRRRSSV
jgi:hypothetical protein